MKSIKFALIVLSVFLFSIMSYAQYIDTVLFLKSISPSNVTVNELDAFFDPDNQLVAYSSVSGNGESDTLVVYDFLHDEILYEKHGTSWDYNLQFINATRLLCLNLDDTIRSVMNFSSPVEKVIYIKPNHVRYLTDFAVSKDKSLLVTLTWNNNHNYQVTWFKYDIPLDTLTVVDSVYINDLSLEADIAISDNRKFVALNGGYENDSVTIIDMETREVHVISTSVNGGTWSPVFFRQNNKLKLAVGGGYTKGNIEIIDVETMALEKSVPAFLHYVYSLAVDTSEQYLACGGYDRELRIFNLKNLSFDTVFTSRAGCIDKIRFTPDNKYLLAGQGYPDARLDFYEIIDSSLSTAVTKPLMNDIFLYPLPVRDKLIIVSPAGITYFSLYSIKGDFIKCNPLKNHEIDFTGLPAGMYLVNFFSIDGAVFSKKIIKQ